MASFTMVSLATQQINCIRKYIKCPKTSRVQVQVYLLGTCLNANEPFRYGLQIRHFLNTAV